jgi:hypothetical protein
LKRNAEIDAKKIVVQASDGRDAQWLGPLVGRAAGCGERGMVGSRRDERRRSDPHSCMNVLAALCLYLPAGAANATPPC